MATGATTVSVTVGGVTSNTLPFTIDNTAYQGIRFVDTVNGSSPTTANTPTTLSVEVTALGFTFHREIPGRIIPAW